MESTSHTPRSGKVPQALEDLFSFAEHYPDLKAELMRQLSRPNDAEKAVAASFGLTAIHRRATTNATLLYCVNRADNSHHIVKMLPSREEYIAEMLNMDPTTQDAVLKRRYTGMKQRIAREAEVSNLMADNPYFVHREASTTTPEDPTDEIGRTVIVMPFVSPGITASEFVASTHVRDNLNLSQRREFITAVGMQMARGISTLHDAGYAYVGVKPGNVLVHPETDNGGFISMIDLGAATQLDNPNADTKLLASPEVCAPELGQAYLLKQNFEPTVASDIYALGCTLFTLITRHPPFMERGSQEMLIAHMHRPRPRAELEQTWFAKGPLTDLIMECMAIEPQKRPKSMQEVALRLEQILQEQNPELIEMASPNGHVSQLTSKSAVTTPAPTTQDDLSVALAHVQTRMRGSQR